MMYEEREWAHEGGKNGFSSVDVCIFRRQSESITMLHNPAMLMVIATFIPNRDDSRASLSLCVYGPCKGLGDPFMLPFPLSSPAPVQSSRHQFTSKATFEPLKLSRGGLPHPLEPPLLLLLFPLDLMLCSMKVRAPRLSLGLSRRLAPMP